MFRHIHFGESRESAINAVSHLSTLLDEEHMYGGGKDGSGAGCGDNFF